LVSSEEAIKATADRVTAGAMGWVRRLVGLIGELNMKRMLGIILTMAVAFTFSADAALAQGTTFGVKGGITSSKLRGTFLEPDLLNVQFQRKTSFVIGGFVAFPIGSTTQLQPEFLYTRRTTNAVDDALNINAQFTFDYLEIPLLFKFSRGADGVTSPAFYVGPTVAIELSAKVTDEALGSDVDVSDEFVDVEFGIVLGGGIDFGQRAYIDVRYSLGLSNIVKDDVFDNGIVSANDAFKWGVLTLMVGVGF
jgi:hypothetical protein